MDTRIRRGIHGGCCSPSTCTSRIPFMRKRFFGLLTVLFFILHRYSKNTVYFLLCGLCAVLAYEARTAGIALARSVGGGQPPAEGFQAHRDCARNLASSDSERDRLDRGGGVLTRVQEPAYAYQTAPYLYFNVSYARNMLTMVDPSNPQLGPLTERALVRRVWANVQAIPISMGQAVSSWVAPPYVSLPLGALVLMGLLLQLARKQYLMLMYVALSLAAVCLTPFPRQFVRYLLPLYPFFALAIFQFLTPLIRKSGSRWLVLPTFARSALIWLVVCVVTMQTLMVLTELYGIEYHNVAYGAGWAARKYRLFYYEPVGTAFDEALDWLQHRAERTDVIARHRSTVGIYENRHKNRAATVRANGERKKAQATRRHCACEVPDRRNSAPKL